MNGATAFEGIHVGSPRHYESLTIFPLFADKSGGADYELSDEAIAAGTVTVEEVSESGSVPYLRVINRGARIPLCGMISEYNATSHPTGPNLRPLLVNRAMIKGFIVSDHNDRAPAFIQEVAPLVVAGRIKFREDIVDGLDSAPAALIRICCADATPVANAATSATRVTSRFIICCSYLIKCLLQNHYTTRAIRGVTYKQPD